MQLNIQDEHANDGRDSKSSSDEENQGLSKKAIAEATAILFNIIYSIFTTDCPKATRRLD